MLWDEARCLCKQANRPRPKQAALGSSLPSARAQRDAAMRCVVKELLTSGENIEGCTLKTSGIAAIAVLVRGALSEYVGRGPVHVSRANAALERALKRARTGKGIHFVNLFVGHDVAKCPMEIVLAAFAAAPAFDALDLTFSVRGRAVRCVVRELRANGVELEGVIHNSTTLNVVNDALAAYVTGGPEHVTLLNAALERALEHARAMDPSKKVAAKATDAVKKRRRPVRAGGVGEETRFLALYAPRPPVRRALLRRGGSVQFY